MLNDSLISKGYDVFSTRYNGSWMNKKNLDVNKDGKLNESDEVEVRSAYIKSKHVRLALMLHHNSWKRNRSVNGIEVYYLGAENEKKLHSPKRYLISPEFCTVYSDSSRYIAEKIVQGFLDKGIKAKTMCCNLPLIRNNPARITVLTEFGYVSNKEDLKRAMSKEYQELYVGIVADVINANRDYIFGNEFYAPLLDTRSITSESAQALYDRLLFNHIKKGDANWFDLDSGRQNNLSAFRTDYVQKEKERRLKLFAMFLKEKGRETYRAKNHVMD
jgi:hypothetical protein